MFLTASVSNWSNVLSLIGVIIVFVLVLGFAYLATRWIGAVGISQGRERNIKIIESCRVNRNKYVQIVKIGKKYIAIGIGKDEITFLGEVEEEGLHFQENEVKPLPDFKEVLSKIK